VPEAKQSAQAQDLNFRAIGWGALAIVVGIVFAIGASYAVWRYLGLEPGPNRGPGHAQAASPRLLIAPQPDRAAYFAEKAKVTNSYGWVDKQAGIARIPVDQAMQLMAERAQAQGGGR
jgi:hypothetical protein